MPTGVEHLLAPSGAGPFATKQVAIRALGCHPREADKILKDLGVKVFTVGTVEFISETELREALAERRRIALGISSAAEAVENVKARAAAEQQALAERMDRIDRQIGALTEAMVSLKGSTPVDEPIDAPAPAPAAVGASK